MSGRRFDLKQEEELRFEVRGDESIKVVLLSGTAELFGTELAPKKAYEFKGVSLIAVFTWHGCTVEINGACSVIYVSEETPMISYINTHAALENMRNDARQKGSDGPRVLIAGPCDSGKSTLARVLLSYAKRAEREPIFVDLDVGQNDITVPGNVGAVALNEPCVVSVEKGVEAKAPMAYFFGHESPSHNIAIYKRCVDQLAESVQRRRAKFEQARVSGLVINTCGWVDGDGYQLLLHAARTFKANVILVLGAERLFSQLKSESFAGKQHVSVVKLTKSGGVVTRVSTDRREMRKRSFREYFYGFGGGLYPHQKTVSFKDVVVCRVGGNVTAPSSALPVGKQGKLDPNRAQPVNPTKDLEGSVLALSHMPRPESNKPSAVLDQVKHVYKYNVAGYVHVTTVDLKKKQLTLLCPCPGPMPGTYLMHGSLKWFE